MLSKPASIGQRAIYAITSPMACAGEGGSCGQYQVTPGWLLAMMAAIFCALAEEGDDLKP
jgi:hypothetical protein